MKTKSFQHRLFLYISAILLLCTGIWGPVAIHYIYSNLTDNAQKTGQELSTLTSTNIDTLFSEMDKLALYTSTNPEVREAMSSMYAQDPTFSIPASQTTVPEILTSIAVPNSSAKFRINIINQNGFFVTTGIPTKSSFVNNFLVSETYAYWYAELPIIHKQKVIVFEPQDVWAQTEDEFITLYREIFHPIYADVSTGVVQVQCPASILDEFIDYESSNICAYIIDEQGHVLRSTQNSLPFGTPFQSYALENPLAFEDGVRITTPLDNSWQLILTQSAGSIYQLMLPIMLYAVGLLLLFLLITMILIYVITKRITRPLQLLIHRVQDVSLDNLHLSTEVSSFNEFEKLNGAFSHMFTRLRTAMDENEKRKTYELQANLIALQSQMDPHFLFNILSVIKSLNREQNHRQIDHCCEYLAKMLRYISTYDDKEVTLQEELDYALLYLNLMKFRYEDQFEFSLSIDDSLDLGAVYINKLIMQPLLENCFQHGFKNTLPVWTITIECERIDEQWCLTIADNGSGISKQNINRINEAVQTLVQDTSGNISNMKLGGMGMVNTFARLKLNYGENIAYAIDENEPHGTMMTIKGVLAS